MPPFRFRYFAEARFAQKVDGFGGTLAAAAVCDNFLERIQLSRAPGKIAERDQMAADIANLILVRLADVENIEDRRRDRAALSARAA